MPKAKKIIESEVAETPAKETVKSAAYLEKKAFYDAYAKQNPAKYEGKKASFEKVLASL